MAEIAHLAWYRQGTVSVSDGSTKVTGSGTKFLTAGINQGAAFRIDSRPYAWEIKRVVSDTELELAAPYYGGTISNASYSIDRNHQSTLPADLSARLAKAMGNWEERYDTDMRTITGPSAYDVAKANGYTGTEAQWLEDLKAAQEWTRLNARTEILTYNSASAHNAFYRGKSLGTAITAAQLAAIRDGTFADLYPGDYWIIAVNGTNIPITICGFDVYHGDEDMVGTKHHVVVWAKRVISQKINETATCAGHILDSYLYKTVFPVWQEHFETALGSDVVLSFTDEVADSIDEDGNVNHRTAAKSKLFLPSFSNITGQDGLAINLGWKKAGLVQWPLFRHNGGRWCGFLSDSYNATQWYFMSWYKRRREPISAKNNYTVIQAARAYPCFLLG